MQKKKKREARAANPPDDVSDGEFTFIAGYTSNGAPYGICWEEPDGLGFFLDMPDNTEWRRKWLLVVGVFVI